MNKLLAIIIAGLFSVNVAAATNAIPDARMQKVLISQVIDHPALNMTTQGVIEGLAAAGYIPGKNITIHVESAQGNAVLAAQIANKFVTQNPDVVVAVGTISAQSFIKYAAAKRVKLVFSTVTDPAAANLTANPQDISGVSNFVSLEPQLQLFKNLQPNLQRLGVIYNPGEINSVSIVQKLEVACVAENIQLSKQTVAKTADVAQAAIKLAGTVDAILISNDNTALSSLQNIIKAAKQRNIPVYVSDTDAVALGAVAALGPNQRAVGKQTGLMVAKILRGAAIQTLPIEYPAKTELALNLVAANNARVTVPATILSQADSVIRLSKS